MPRPFLVALCLCALGALPVHAQDGGTGVTPSLRTSCIGDYFRFCGGMDPGGAEVRTCFRRNIAQVSSGCRAAIVVAFPADARRLRPR